MIINPKEEQAYLGENDVLDLDGYKIAAANFNAGPYTDYLGHSQTGPHFSLYLFESDHKLILGQGCQVYIKDQLWLVHSITIISGDDSSAGYSSGSHAKLVPILQTKMVKTSPQNTKLYTLSFILSLSLAIYLYLIAFDDFSESQLIQYSYLWLSLLIFSWYGRKAIKIKQALNQRHQLKKELQGLVYARQMIGMLALVFLFPLFKYEKWSPFQMALSGSLVWLIFLEVFYLTMWKYL